MNSDRFAANWSSDVCPTCVRGHVFTALFTFGGLNKPLNTAKAGRHCCCCRPIDFWCPFCLPRLFLDAETFVETVNAAAGIYQLLPSGKERMAFGTDFNTDVRLRGPVHDFSAGTANGGGSVLGMVPLSWFSPLLMFVNKRLS
jgi:hypothetical protein